MLQACLNGNRPTGAHVALPLSPEQLADDARAVVAAGADELHVHPRDAEGDESLLAGPVAAAIEAIRAAAPGVPLGLSSGEWIAPGGAARIAAMQAWRVLPDYLSINLCESDAPPLIDWALEAGVGVEAGIWSPADLHRLIDKVPPEHCLRVLLELPPGTAAESRALGEALLDGLARAGWQVPVLLHGEGSSAWPCVALAAERGLSTRIGLEDTLVLPDGETAADNAALVREARRRLGG